MNFQVRLKPERSLWLDLENALELNSRENSIRSEGAGAKVKNPEVGLKLVWNELRVSKRIIMDMARELFVQNTDEGDVCCKGSRGWLEKFLKRKRFSLRRRTRVA